MRRTRNPSQDQRGRTSTRSEPIENGRKVRDNRDQQDGTILDHACQYAHPKADPVYSYLIRWDDGQVQAISEAALTGGAYDLLP